MDTNNKITTPAKATKINIANWVIKKGKKNYTPPSIDKHPQQH